MVVLSDEAEGRVADATGNWVDRYAPAATRPYLRLSRADRPVGTWLLLIPCWWGVSLAVATASSGWRLYDLWIALGCGLGAVLMRGAGCTWNDITDRDYDAKVTRTRSRPLPSGQVGVRQAMLWMIAQALLAFVILLSFAPLAIVLGVGSLGLVAVYPFAKRFTWWPQVFLGLAFNWGAILAWAARGEGLGWPALALFMTGIAWTLFYDTIYAHQDRDDDALIGVKSTARLFGASTARWLVVFGSAATVLALVAVLGAKLAMPALALAFLGIGGFGGHLLWQLRQLEIHDPAICLRLFRTNRDAGLLLAAGLALAATV
jgi:4-hydroxybenzoate polyprenyltransferase